MIRVRTSSGLLPVSNIRIRGSSSLDTVATGRVRGASSLDTFFTIGGGSAAFNLVVNPLYPTGSTNNPSPIAVTTGICTATPSGGTAPYTYLWEAIGSPGSSGVWSIINVSTGVVRFQCASVAAGIEHTKDFKVTVTDALGRSVVSQSINAYAVNYYGGIS